MNNKMEVLNTALEYMVKMKWGIKETAEAFQSSDDDRALSFMPYIFDGLEWIIYAVDLTRSEQSEEIKIESILEQVKAMIEAFENTDYILVADLLYYEILPIIEQWEQIIRKSIAN